MNSGWLINGAAKPLFIEIEKNNCFSIYTRGDLDSRGDLDKIREETLKKNDLIDGSNREKG